jgi:hypothetical protein
MLDMAEGGMSTLEKLDDAFMSQPLRGRESHIEFYFVSLSYCLVECQKTNKRVECWGIHVHLLTSFIKYSP